ncbi:MAG: PhoU domain-containing protein [Candidatus Thermoplasmatota archaeon]|nr:PhoU domain-containing protein [Candidatus Thermoplasmatota archaeon]
MAPPIRTNLDARMGFIRNALEEFIRPVKQAYTMAINGLSTGTEMDSKDVQKKRMKAQQRAEDLSQELLLVLTLNQPLLQDLRIVACYLRGIDVIERLARHARDIANAQDSFNASSEGSEIPKHLAESLTELGQKVFTLLEQLEVCLVQQTELPGDLKDQWLSIQSLFEEISLSILEEQKSNVAGREGRLNLNLIARRFERSAYNLMRLADLWHHALENEWIHLESIE